MKDLPLFYAPHLREDLQLPEGEAQHALRVLRAQVGDEFLVTDGQGTLFETRVTGVDRRHCLLSILHEEPWQKYWRGTWSVAIAPTKSLDRIEWMLEKMVEVGLDEIFLIKTKHSERKHTSADRLERIIQSAMKQSHKALLPTLTTDLPFSSLLEATSDYDLRLLAHCREGLSPRAYDHRPSLPPRVEDPPDDRTRRRLLRRRDPDGRSLWMPAHHPRLESPTHRDRRTHRSAVATYPRHDQPCPPLC